LILKLLNGLVFECGGTVWRRSVMRLNRCWLSSDENAWILIFGGCEFVSRLSRLIVSLHELKQSNFERISREWMKQRMHSNAFRQKLHD
jgi:hypothetical protein